MPYINEQKKKIKVEEFQTKLGKEDVKSYERNLFNDMYQGGQEEAEALIERYSAEIELTEDEKQRLRENVPEPPAFQKLNKEQYNNENCWGRRKYRGKMKDYYKNRKMSYITLEKLQKEDGKLEEKESKGQIYARTRQEIEERIEQKKIQQVYPEIEETAKAMDLAYKNGSKNKTFIEMERNIGKEELRLAEKMTPGFQNSLNIYSGPEYQSINQELRTGGKLSKTTKTMIEGFQKNTLNRDIVCRRGVNGLETLGFMMGYDKQTVDTMKVDGIKNDFLSKFRAGEEVILSDKSFMSTALPQATQHFGAGKNGHRGIEFMILMKKGTQALNISSISEFEQEQEVLVAPGTKFKVIKAELDGKADILHGHKKSWKIWMVSIPPEEQEKQK